MQPRLNRLSVQASWIQSPGAAGRGFNRIQDNRTLLSGIESYGAGGNKTLTGVNFAELSQKTGADAAALRAREQRGKKERGN
jgi:hypothetical protein